MADLVVTYEDLKTFLGVDNLDIGRAQMMVELATQACSTIVTLTSDAKFVVLSVAARVYTTPVPVGNQVAGPFAQSGTVGGISLTRAEERQLRRLAGSGGAFSINPLADDAGTGLPWWDAMWDPDAS